MITLLATAAHAQVVTGGDVPEINAQRFRPAVDATKTLWTDDAIRSPHNTGTMRLLLHHTQEPLVWVGVDGTEVDLVRTILQTDLLGSYSYGRLRVGAVVPVYLRTQGEAFGGETGLGDLAADGRFTAIDGPRAPLDLAVGLRVGFPTATVQTALGSPTPTWELSVIADRQFGKALLAANVSTRGGPATELENVSLNDAFLFRVAAGYAVTPSAGTALEFAGDLPYLDFGNAASGPIEVLLGGWAAPAPQWVVRGGVGTGLTAGIGSPDYRLIVGLGYEPRNAILDTDGDGLFDNVDQCVDEPEDLDRWRDEDGCPDPDNDEDGILDLADACRDVAEDYDTWRDEDGCPDPEAQVTVRVVDTERRPIDLARFVLSGPNGETQQTGPEHVMVLPPGSYTAKAMAGTYEAATQDLTVVDGPPYLVELVLQKKKDVKVAVTKERINLQDVVYFRTSSDQIKPESFGLLDQAAQILAEYPEIALLRIEGHTDTRGDDAFNLDLSRRRAESVRTYLIEKGVAAARLKSEGFGETRPLDPAETEAAWAKNRRVDFLIERWVDAPR